MRGSQKSWGFGTSPVHLSSVAQLLITAGSHMQPSYPSPTFNQQSNPPNASPLHRVLSAVLTNLLDVDIISDCNRRMCSLYLFLLCRIGTDGSWIFGQPGAAGTFFPSSQLFLPSLAPYRHLNYTNYLSECLPSQMAVLRFAPIELISAFWEKKLCPLHSILQPAVQ